jgi:hypothetical protein
MVLTRCPLLPALALSLLLLGSCGEKKDPSPSIPDTGLYTKDLTLLLFTETNYSEPRWEDSKMKVSLQLRRRSTTLPKEQVLLDTTIGWIPFRQLPLKGNPIQVYKLLRDIHKEQDDLLLDVKKVVSVNDYETEFNYTQALDHDKQQEIVEVKL